MKSFSTFVKCCSLSAILLVGCSSTPKQESTGQYLDSSAITTKVKADLLANDQVKSFPISVNTYKGVVQLSGFVNSARQKEVAGQVARNVSGVQGVDNDLVVK